MVREGLGFGFDIGNLTGGPVGTVGWCARKTPLLLLATPLLLKCLEYGHPYFASATINTGN